jgi:bacterioferritin-associated ferredoxin
MIDLNSEVCICNSVTFNTLIQEIQQQNISNLTELLANESCPVGDKCESCREDGYNNDGLNLSLALSLAKKRN